jgi:hypothetical protein
MLFVLVYPTAFKPVALSAAEIALRRFPEKPSTPVLS